MVTQTLKIKILKKYMTILDNYELTGYATKKIKKPL